MRYLRLAALALLATIAACGEVYRDTSVEMTTVDAVDVERYQGRWFEIARYPNFFEEGCVGVHANYAIREDGRIDVRNVCRQGTLDGEVNEANGIARVVSPGKLEVTFTPWLPGVWGDYWVLHLEPDYSVVVVGSPGGRVGWILARDVEIDEGRMARALAALEANGYDLNGLEYPEQGPV
ncbi:MAG: lipocalin family protein [Pseudomonadota bacterium]